MKARADMTLAEKHIARLKATMCCPQDSENGPVYCPSCADTQQVLWLLGDSQPSAPTGGACVRNARLRDIYRAVSQLRQDLVSFQPHGVFDASLLAGAQLIVAHLLPEDDPVFKAGGRG